MMRTDGPAGDPASLELPVPLRSEIAPMPVGAISTPWSAVLKVLTFVSAVALLGLAVMISADVTYRWLFGRPIVGVFEFSEILLVGITFLVIARVQFSGSQLRVDVLAARARGRLAGGLGVLDALVGLAFFGILLWTGAQDWWEALHGGFMGRGILQIPLAIPIGLVAFGSALMVVTLLILLGRALRLTLFNRPRAPGHSPSS